MALGSKKRVMSGSNSCNWNYGVCCGQAHKTVSVARWWPSLAGAKEYRGIPGSDMGNLNESDAINI
jgi:hypothetical protein